jgi:hypothetical protein
MPRFRTTTGEADHGCSGPVLHQPAALVCTLSPTGQVVLALVAPLPCLRTSADWTLLDSATPETHGF